MTWVLLKKTKIAKNPLNKSEYARRRSASVWKTSMTPQIKSWLNEPSDNRSDLYIRYQDLRIFADEVDFKWPDQLPSPVPLARTKIERMCLVPSPKDFRDILEDVLGDIARVAIASDIRPGEQWKVPDKGWLIMHFKDAASPGPKPSGFQELNFYFYKGRSGDDPHFYWWRMQYAGDPALPALTITTGAAFSSVTKISDSVWMVGRRDRRKVVIKYEQSTQPFKEYKCRYEYIVWLARKAFEGVPNSALLTGDELKIISKMGLQEVTDPQFTTDHPDNQQTTLANAAKLQLENPGINNFYFTKISSLEMGSNLEKRIAHINQLKVAKDRERARKSLRTLLFDSTNLERFGEMAVFDLIVTNNDRFPEKSGRHGVVVSLKNIDFTSTGQPVALDNVSPSGPYIVRNNWPGQVHLVNSEVQREYAEMVLIRFIEKTGFKEYYKDKEDIVSTLENHFYQGMQNGARKLKTLIPALRDKAREDTDEFGRTLGDVIAERISSTFA